MSIGANSNISSKVIASLNGNKLDNTKRSVLFKDNKSVLFKGNKTQTKAKQNINFSKMLNKSKEQLNINKDNNNLNINKNDNINDIKKPKTIINLKADNLLPIKSMKRTPHNEDNKIDAVLVKNKIKDHIDNKVSDERIDKEVITIDKNDKKINQSKSSKSIKISDKIQQNKHNKHMIETKDETNNEIDKEINETPKETNKEIINEEIKEDNKIIKEAQENTGEGKEENKGNNKEGAKLSTQLDPKVDKKPSNTLSVKNALKYGAFKAFDSIATLKPSNGVKLSELIKEADKRALNLSKISHEVTEGVGGRIEIESKVKVNAHLNKPIKIDKEDKVEGDKVKKQDEVTLRSNIKEDKKTISANQIDIKLKEHKQNLVDTSISQVKVVDNIETKSDLKDNLEHKIDELRDNLSSQKTTKVTNKIDKNNKINANNINYIKDIDNKNKDRGKIETKHPLKEDIKNNGYINNTNNNIYIKPEAKPSQYKTENHHPLERNNDNKGIENILKNMLESKAKDQQHNEDNLDNKDVKWKKDAIEIKETLRDVKQDGRVFTELLKYKNQEVEIKETFDRFFNNLSNEIKNFKPPLHKITLELSPANLGQVEVSISLSGNNISVQMNANANTMYLLMQRESALRDSLGDIGFSDVSMNFSSAGNNSQGSFSGSSFRSFGEQFNDDAPSHASTLNNLNEANEDGRANLELMLINTYV